MHRKNGLNDYDKVLVTFALWVSAIALFATAFTLPMLPDYVTVFRVADELSPKYYSKYNNLIIILMSVIPATIIVITSLLKRRNRLQNNFLSIMLFSIMLSLCMSCVIIYGIMQQFDASTAIDYLNKNALATIIADFILSVIFSVFPAILHRKAAGVQNVSAEKNDKRIVGALTIAVEKYWGIGAFGMLGCAIVCAFMPGYYCYIPFAASVLFYVVFIIVRTLNLKNANA